MFLVSDTKGDRRTKIMGFLDGGATAIAGLNYAIYSDGTPETERCPLL